MPGDQDHSQRTSGWLESCAHTPKGGHRSPLQPTFPSGKYWGGGGVGNTLPFPDLQLSAGLCAYSGFVFLFPNLQLYSSGLVECESDNPSDHERNFDVESVKKEIKRGRKLVSTNDCLIQDERASGMPSKERLSEKIMRLISHG